MRVWVLLSGAALGAACAGEYASAPGATTPPAGPRQLEITFEDEDSLFDASIGWTDVPAEGVFTIPGGDGSD